MGHLREQPVVIAGHDLSPMQKALAAWGSYLVVPPWVRSNGSPIVALDDVEAAVVMKKP